jgi:hypothetical protein
MKSFTKEIYVDPAVTEKPNGFAVTVYDREGRNFYHKRQTHVFPTLETAKQFQTDTILAGGRWTRTDMVPTQDFTDLPDIRAWKDPNGALTVTVDGRTVIARTTDPQALKAAIRAHPKASALSSEPCRRCGGNPRINLSQNTLKHECEFHKIEIVDPLIPVTIKIAAWNLHFSKRRSKLRLGEVYMAHFVALGFMREPSDRDMLRRIRKVEVIDGDT